MTNTSRIDIKENALLRMDDGILETLSLLWIYGYLDRSCLSSKVLEHIGNAIKKWGSYLVIKYKNLLDCGWRRWRTEDLFSCKIQIC